MENDEMKIDAKRFLKSELTKRDITYVQLAKLMQEKGYNENADTIRTKIYRGSFSFAFVLAVCESINIDILFKDKTY